MLRIFCKNTGTAQNFPEGTTLLEMLSAFTFDRPYPIVSAKVNNVSQGLKFKVYNNKDIEFLDVRSDSGMRVYCRSLFFLLCKAARDVFPDGRIITARGEAHGVILRERRGEDGFGYDPVFYSTDLNKTFAEASADEKNKVSHRGRALTLFSEKLKGIIC